MPSYRKKPATVSSSASLTMASSLPSAPAHVGDVCGSKGLPLSFSRDPVLEAMHRGDVLWGDIMPLPPCDLAADARRLAVWRNEAAAAAAEAVEAARRLQSDQEAAFWAQPFAENMELYFSDSYDLRQLSDEEYAACMTWLYDQGWAVMWEDRAGVSAVPADLPPRVWVSQIQAELVAAGQSRFAALAPDDGAVAAVTHHPVPGRRAPQPKPKVRVQRFCRDSRGGVPCADPACRYVHADTIPCVDEVCGFDLPAEGKCCTGDKRTLCTRMHPSEGQVWSANLVVTRPAA
jgi:hypothetical protein